MSKQRKTKLKKTDDSVLLDKLAASAASHEIETASDKDLFFEDVVGETQSRKHSKKSTPDVAVSSGGKATVASTYQPPRPAPKPFTPRVTLTRHERAARSKSQAELAAHRAEIDRQLAEQNMTVSEALALANSIVSRRALNCVTASDETFDAPAHDLWDEEPVAMQKLKADTRTAASLPDALVRRLANLEPLRRLAAEGKKGFRDAAPSREHVIQETRIAPAGTSVNPHPAAYAELVEIAEERARREALRKQRLDTRTHIPEDYQVRLPEKLLPSAHQIAAMAHLYEPAVAVPTPEKTRQDRNRERKAKAARVAEVRARLQEKKLAEIDKIPDFLAEVDAEEARLELRRQRSAEARVLRGPKTIHFGGKRFVQPFPAVPLAEELTSAGSSLRRAPVAANVAGDSFSELQRKNIIPTPRTARRVRPNKKRVLERKGDWHVTDAAEMVAKAEQLAAENPRQWGPSKRARGAAATATAGVIAASTGADTKVAKKTARRKRALAVPDHTGGHDDDGDALSIFD